MDTKNLNDEQKLKAAESLIKDFDKALIHLIILRSETDNEEKMKELNDEIDRLEDKRKKTSPGNCIY